MKQKEKTVISVGEPIIIVKNLYKFYQAGSEKVHALDGLDFEINKGEFCAIIGPSGSGKSTLLNMLAGLEKPSRGEIIINGKHIEKLNENQLVRFRRDHIGFIFQSYNLLPKTTSVENVELPLMYNGSYNAAQRKAAAVKALEAVGLGDRLYHKSNQMSGGQMQRVAIARALVNDPTVILADEATGNLDTRTSFEMLVLFQKLYEEGRTIIFVTHNPDIARYSSRNIVLRDGKIRDDEINTDILSAAEALAKIPKPKDDL